MIIYTHAHTYYTHTHARTYHLCGYTRITATENHRPPREIWMANVPSPKLGGARRCVCSCAVGYRVRGIVAETVGSKKGTEEGVSFLPP